VPLLVVLVTMMVILVFPKWSCFQDGEPDKPIGRGIAGDCTHARSS
jgi:hypothetical protein